MSKSLKTIQTLSKICRILSKIVFICCIVGAVLCIIGLAGLGMGADNSVKLGGVTVYGLLQDVEGLDTKLICAISAQVLVFAIAEAIVAKFAEVYFKNELKTGTPFTFEGAKEMRRLGILAIALSLAAAIIAGIIVTPLGAEEYQISGDVAVGTGLMLLVLSVIFKYGAEVAQSAEQKKLADGDM